MWCRGWVWSRNVRIDSTRLWYNRSPAPGLPGQVATANPGTSLLARVLDLTGGDLLLKGAIAVARLGLGIFQRQRLHLHVPREKTPRRPVATQDRYEAIREKAEEHTFEVRWNGRRERQRSYLAELLDIVNGTGRRISAVCSLRFEDLRLDKTKAAPYGAIRCPADTDKKGPKKPISRRLASRWLREAEKVTDLETQKGSLWHAYRRKWATERKHLPDVDVAAAGGWQSLDALKQSYQQADDATMLQVVMSPGELREAK